MTDINALHRAAASARTARDAARASVREGALRLHEIQRELAEAHRGDAQPGRGRQNVGTVARLEREQAGLRATVAAAARDLAKGREHTTATLNDFFRDPDEPRLSTGRCVAVPPVSGPDRDEVLRRTAASCAFGSFPTTLRLRISRKSSPSMKRRRGRNTGARGRMRMPPPLQRSARNSSAAPGTCSPRGTPSYRAGWITQSTKPLNWAASVTDPTTLIFPVIATKPLAWSEAPRSPVMPDVFAVILERGNASRTVFGKLVPDDLPLGPDPLQVEGFLTRDPTTNRLKISNDLRWLIDFAAAEAVGMGIRIPLTAAEAADGFDRIMVLGHAALNPRH